MNRTYLIIAAIIFVVVMLVFGKNPADDARRHHEEAMIGKDPLVEAIKEHNQNPLGTHMSGLSFGGLGSGGNMVAPHPPASMVVPGPAPAVTPYTQPAPPAQNQNSYYPPPAGPANAPMQARPFGPQSFMNLLLPGATPVKLASGKEVAFAGTEVYTTDAHGNAVKLADGNYPLFNGRIHMLIRGGQKIIVSN